VGRAAAIKSAPLASNGDLYPASEKWSERASSSRRTNSVDANAASHAVHAGRMGRVDTDGWREDASAT
jgi:hypothetical protein